MNRARRAILVFYALAVTFLCVWVPWKVKLWVGTNVYYQRLPYGWVWSGPRAISHDSYDFKGSEVDLRSVALEVIPVTALCGVAFLVIPVSGRRRGPS